MFEAQPVFLSLRPVVECAGAFAVAGKWPGEPHGRTGPLEAPFVHPRRHRFRRRSLPVGLRSLLLGGGQSESIRKHRQIIAEMGDELGVMLAGAFLRLKEQARAITTDDGRAALQHVLLKFRDSLRRHVLPSLLLARPIPFAAPRHTRLPDTTLHG